MSALRSLALALAGVAFALPQAAAAEVVVVKQGGGIETVSLPSGEEDVRERAYTVRSGSGERTETVTGFSLAWVLERAGVDLFTFGYVEVQRPSGAPVYLDNAQARNRGAFADGPPVVWRQGNQTRFLRPSAGASDRNAGDVFGASPLRVRVRDGELIDVKASASKVRAKPGEPVTFTARVDRAQSGQELVYSWSFNDGESARGATVTHRFAQPGRYAVTVGVTTSTDATGGSDTVMVTVGKVRRKGPDREGGGRNRDKRAPDSGPSDSGQGAGPASAGGPGDGGREDPSRARSERKRAPGEEPIEGELLDPNAMAEPAGEERPSVAARTGNPSEREKGFGLPPGAWGALVAGALLGTGALRELGKLPQPKGRNPWS